MRMHLTLIYYKQLKIRWTTARDKIKQGFVDFGNWLASIPAKIKLMAVQVIDSATPDWLIDMSDDIEAAKAAVAAFQRTETPTAGQEAAVMTYQDAILREAERAASVANIAVDASDNSTTDNSTTGVINLGGDGSAMISEDEVAAGWAAEAHKYASQ